MKGNGCACIDSATATYFRSDGLDKFLVGDFYGQPGADPENFPQNASVESLEELIEHACRRVPKLQNAEIMRGVTGVCDMTPDSRPLLGGDSRSGPACRNCCSMDAAKPLTSALFGSVGLPRGFLSGRNTSTKTTRFVVPPSPRPHRPAELRAERLMKVAEGSTQKSGKGAVHEKKRSS
jgi:hypothetical protein